MEPLMSTAKNTKTGTSTNSQKAKAYTMDDMTKIRNIEEEIELGKVNGDDEFEADDVFFKAKGQGDVEMFNYKDVKVFRIGGIDKYYEKQIAREKLIEGPKAGTVEGLE